MYPMINSDSNKNSKCINQNQTVAGDEVNLKFKTLAKNLITT